MSRGAAPKAGEVLQLQGSVGKGFFPPLLPVVSTFIEESVWVEREEQLAKKHLSSSPGLPHHSQDEGSKQGAAPAAEPRASSSKSCVTEATKEEGPVLIATSAPGSDPSAEGDPPSEKNSDPKVASMNETALVEDAVQQRLLDGLGVSRLLDGEEDDFTAGRTELWCHYRNCRKDTDRKELLLCTKCRRAFHASCCDPPLNYEMVTRFPWQCTECKTCQLCGSNKNEDTMLICDACDRAYHMECMKPPVGQIPEGDWFCPACGHCHCCGRELTDAEALDSSCFYSNQHRICPECKDSFSEFIASQGLASSSRSPATRQESQPTSRRVRSRAAEMPPDHGKPLSDGDAGKQLLAANKCLCVVCIKPLIPGQSGSVAGGREKLNASVICAECKQGAHVRCCESIVKRHQSSAASADSGTTTIVCNTCASIWNDFCFS